MKEKQPDKKPKTQEDYHSLIFCEQTMTYEERIQVSETGLFILIPRTSLKSFNSIMFMFPQLSYMVREAIFVDENGQVSIRNEQALRVFRARLKQVMGLLKDFHHYTLSAEKGVISEKNEPLPEFLDILIDEEQELKVNGLYPIYERVCTQATRNKFHSAMCTLYDVDLENYKKRKFLEELKVIKEAKKNKKWEHTT